ncbi:unnamed protein product [Acanthoscelides obtectus]|uniref:Transforming acidic coiled-coil-containing protein C-terminal domain-containing protein n=1 Tax=Acanthoscelides obtectus TaxID=200917 RepID=A0A9P0K140_ACAOB|nr:unnamed protein product [Acanthoscelides obtectus]CAK1627531.1 Transforming acidic coiled-coil-containing protein 3 [Acanthoscelides obtectus]
MISRGPKLNNCHLPFWSYLKIPEFRCTANRRRVVKSNEKIVKSDKLDIEMEFEWHKVSSTPKENAHPSIDSQHILCSRSLLESLVVDNSANIKSDTFSELGEHGKNDLCCNEVLDDTIDAKKYEELNETDKEAYNHLLVSFSSSGASSELNHKDLSDSCTQKSFSGENSVEFKPITADSQGPKRDVGPNGTDLVKSENDLNATYSGSQEFGFKTLHLEIGSGYIKKDYEAAEDHKNTVATLTDAEIKFNRLSQVANRSSGCLDISSKQLAVESSEGTTQANSSDIKINKSPEIVHPHVEESKQAIIKCNNPDVIRSAGTEYTNGFDTSYNTATDSPVCLSFEDLNVDIVEQKFDNSLEVATKPPVCPEISPKEEVESSNTIAGIKSENSLEAAIRPLVCGEVSSEELKVKQLVKPEPKTPFDIKDCNSSETVITPLISLEVTSKELKVKQSVSPEPKNAFDINHCNSSEVVITPPVSLEVSSKELKVKQSVSPEPKNAFDINDCNSSEVVITPPVCLEVSSKELKVEQSIKPEPKSPFDIKDCNSSEVAIRQPVCLEVSPKELNVESYDKPESKSHSDIKLNISPEVVTLPPSCLEISKELKIESSDKPESKSHSDIELNISPEVVTLPPSCLEISKELKVESSEKPESKRHSDVKVNNSLEVVTVIPVCLEVLSEKLKVESSEKSESKRVSHIKFENLPEIAVRSPVCLEVSSKVESFNEPEQVKNLDTKVDSAFDDAKSDVSSLKLERNKQAASSFTHAAEKVGHDECLKREDTIKFDVADYQSVQNLVEDSVAQVEKDFNEPRSVKKLHPVGEPRQSSNIKEVIQAANSVVKGKTVEQAYQLIEDFFHEVFDGPLKDNRASHKTEVNQEPLQADQIAETEDKIPSQPLLEVPSPRTYKRKMGDINDTMNALQQENSDLKLKLNASQQEKASLELEIRQKEEIIIKSQAEALKSEQLFKQELKQMKEQLKENSKFIENDITKELQDQLKEAKLREAKLLDELAEKKNLERAAEKFQAALKTRVNENVKLKEDLDSAKTHLANLEFAFSDLHSKYEKTKDSLEGYKKHIAELLMNLDSCHLNSRQQVERYESLKTYAKNQIERANRENTEERERYLHENANLQAIIKRLEIKCGSLEVNLSQKIEECKALSALCDEVTGKRV